MTSAPLSDSTLVSAFEDGTLPSSRWTHRSHVRVACLYACRDPLSVATARMRRGLQEYNHTVGTPESLNRGYHETITQTFMRLVGAALHQNGPYISSSAFCDTHPELLRREAINRFYSHDCLFTAEAKAGFVAPDRQPLPDIDDDMWSAGMAPFLETTDIVDCSSEVVRTLAADLQARSDDTESCVRQAFEWVRDRIRHSIDYGCRNVTCRASDVLQYGTGFCYAKSHLLAAVLRACGVPTGFCYQRLSVGDSGPPWCLHGLNAVFLPKHGWYRIDARGNRKGVQAEFTPPHEQLAFAVTEPQESDDPVIYARPLPVVTEALQTATSVQELMEHLPDAPLSPPQTAGSAKPADQTDDQQQRNRH